jgi:large subunit ribosomal protein L25
LASELVLPSGSTLLVDPETLVVNVTEQMSAEALEAELEEAEADLGIERELSDEEEAEQAEAQSDGDSEGDSGDSEGDSEE